MRNSRITVLWAFFILVLCAIPGKDLPHVSFLELLSFDKWVHAGIFFMLVLLMIRGLKKDRPELTFKKIIFVTMISCIAYGGLLEIAQGAVFEDRTADFFDFIANSAGAVAGVLLYRKLAVKFHYLQIEGI